jgi:hypothetical protein
MLNVGKKLNEKEIQKVDFFRHQQRRNFFVQIPFTVSAAM